MTYLLTILLVISLFFLIKKRIEVKRQKRIIIQHELIKQKTDILLNKITVYDDLDAQLAALEYILENIQNYESNRQDTASVR